MGMKFEYDENGAKFVYFILAFYAMIIIPCTYIFWPKKGEKKIKHAEDLSCYEPCITKVQLLNKNAPKKRLNDGLTKAAFVLGWAILIFLAYKASQIKTEHKEYDPYVILGIDKGATDKEIRKKYRELSKIMHPDRGGVEEEFKQLSTAYKSLTDEETKKNWEEYGNPDGPGAMQFGIALPKWIVDGKNSYIVLGIYVLIFMIIMPVVVGTWWYKSIKYTGDKVLIRTSQLYTYLFVQTPQIIIKRAIMILGSSFEYDKGSNPDIIERPTDNTEMPWLMKQLPDLQEKIREFPYASPYSLKARSLIHAHLLRIELPADTLLKDKNTVIKKGPFLINEMVNMVSSLIARANMPNMPQNIREPTLESLENIMRVSPMIVQALWDKYKKQTLLQLPHIEENNLRHFMTKKRNISDIKSFVQMNDEDRRSILRYLTDDQYEDIIRVCGTYPLINLDYKIQIFDDEEEQIITTGAIVTVAVTLKRRDLSELFESEESGDTGENKEDLEVEDLGSAEGKNGKKTQPQSNKNKSKSAAKGNKKPAAKPVAKKEPVKETNEDKTNDSESEDKEVLLKEDGEETKGNTSSKSNEEYFEKFQQIQKKKESLETREKISHQVYCPHFPEVKQEYWWLYVSDRKQRKVISAPVQICTLKDTEEIELKFFAPKVKGTYTYTLNLRSDSYLDFDIMKNFKFEVQTAEEVEDQPQWDMIDEEEDDINGEVIDDEFDTESESDSD